MRSMRLLLPLAVVILAGANLALLVPEPNRARTSEGAQTPWEHWRAMTAEERLGQVRQYQAIAARQDAGRIWQRAREYGRQTPEERARLRELAKMVSAAIDGAPAATRRQLLTASDAARAFLIYQDWLSREPQRVAELRTWWP